MSKDVVRQELTDIAPEVVESVLIKGDLKALTSAQKLAYYKSVCESLGLNPLTQPFAYIVLNGKEQLYAKREATEQLRKVHGISIEIKSREVVEGCYIVTASASMPNGRKDESTGAVAIDGVKGENRANAMLKAETKAKRRVTLSLCGLGMLDETEVDAIPGAYKAEVVAETITLTPSTPPAKVPEPPKEEPIPEPEIIGFDEPEYISAKQRSYLAKRFRESLRPEIAEHEMAMRHDVLGAIHRSGLFKSKLIDDNGNPTSEFVLASEFAAIGKEMVTMAKSL